MHITIANLTYETLQTKSEKPFKCDKCDFAHAYKHGLSSHIKSVHADQSSLKLCHICNFKTASNQNLKIHIEAKHEKIRNFSCPHCDLKFYAKASMAGHIRAYHSDEKRYKCEPCGLAFSLATKLNVHLRVVHEGQKFACEICGSEYNRQESLKKHKFKSHGIKNARKYKYDNE